jgi:hypothetical protein
MRLMTKKYYGGSVTSVGTSVTEPSMEIVLSKQEVIYTKQDNRHILVIRIQTNNRVYWMYNNEILEKTDEFEEMYRILNRDFKINTILDNELE